ncbi:hypothetical protein CSC62_08755 [Pseudoxanthomonas jiangsuensis]|uniref:esterase/lipase family protein n=1 Tax=Pseudoxanthomonas jiangsuensis TaxID=619688 RepID=UPI001390BEE8|nr:alpha/beta hydrolase [Pseudoxanthomonas jiangsuensis]KAF1697280.1 hypothetical protein CSC62_08755 [Pseudoxanthomonas jiangsuensis]
MSTILVRHLVVVLLLCATSGCSIVREFRPSVVIDPMTPGEYIAQQRGDILTTQGLSATTTQTLRVAGLDPHGCLAAASDCIADIDAIAELTDEQRLSAQSEMWLHLAMVRAQEHAKAQGKGGVTGETDTFSPWIEAARHAYAYLFFTSRGPGERAFEDRQTQVRSWYNYAVEQAVIQMFESSLEPVSQDAVIAGAGHAIQRGDWRLRLELDEVRLPEGVDMPRELVPAAALAFHGFQSTYRRDGLGAELVAVMEDDPVSVQVEPEEAIVKLDRRSLRAPAWSEMPSPNLTVLFHFEGADLATVLKTRDIRVQAHDPLRDNEVNLRGQRVPLAANFTAGYGLWLARSGFSQQSLRTLFGRERGIDRPHLYLMQPFDPDRRIILMVHGLASSPEAWVNVANEIMGDEQLRREFQIWQVYYPTNLPVAMNHAAIRRVVEDALKHYDPERTQVASRDMVMVGHSMGGFITRLMVSSAEQELWGWIREEDRIPADRLERMRPRLDPMLRFKPFPGVERAIFIATPHKGTAVAGHRLGRWVSGLVRMPLTLLESFGDVLQNGPDQDRAPKGAARAPNSIDNLDEHDGFVRAAATLPISPDVSYHSIIAQADPAVALQDSDDGLVPYRSSHLAGALSEKVVISGHSVQETAQAILEIRRILHQDLDETEARQERQSGQDVPR